MRSLAGFVFAALSFFLVSSAFAEEEFPWELFLPAIISGGNSLTCEDIAGCYSGDFTDNCAGYSAQGKMNVSIKENCSVTIVSSYGVTSSGSITERNGATYSGTGNTGSNGCGSFSFTAIDKGSYISVNYRYNNGKTGALPSGVSGYCKSENRLRTEMLAGTWRFSYYIGDSYYDDTFAFKIGTITTAPGYSDVYTITGTNEYGSKVYGGYSPDIGYYEVLYPWEYLTGYTGYYKFSLTNYNKASGCYFLLNPYFQYNLCYPLNGTKIK